MVLPKGSFWEHVEEMPDDSRRCKFCGHLFSKLTPITRFKFHWSGVPRRGTTICEKVPELVREAAFAAVDGPPEKNHRITETSSNDGAQQEEALSVKELQERIDRLHVEVDNVAGDAGTTQAADRMGHAFGRSLEEFGRWLMEDAIENGTGGLVQPGAGASSSGGLTGNTNETPGDPLLASLHVEVDNVAPQGQHMERVTGQPVVRGSSHERPLVNHDEPQEDQLCPPLVNMVGNFPLDRVSSFPRDLIPGEQVEQECERNAQENLPLSVEDYRIEGTIMESSQLPVRGGSPERFTVNEDEPRGDLSQPTDPLCFGLERHYDQPSSSSVNNDVMMIDVENMIREHLQPVVRDSSREGLQTIGDESGRDVFLTEELIGGEFENNKNAIWSWIMNDEASSSIGIYGMGGVGKTTLLTHIYNQLLQERGTFPHVHWITVSQDFSVYKLQNLIAKDFHLYLSKEDNERKRAGKLSEALIEKQRWVLILDDLWDCFDYNKVGIPIKVKGCKLILTTRSFGVCKRMDCQKTIKVKPLSMEEAWALFMKVLGCIPPEVEEIAKSVASECAGLPLGIKTMAGTMRGVDDRCEWRNALEDLKQSRIRKDDMEPEVFHILRFSFMHLKESELQQCFLCCALFPEDFKIRREDLIAYLIDEGAIKGLKSREAEFDKGHTMLNKLERVCLLESAKKWSGAGIKMHDLIRYADDRYVKMHDLIRDMAIQILQANSQEMVKAGAQLRELPGAEEWTENLTRVSLMYNQIKKIPSGVSPRCPTLSTLLLCRNLGMQFIADSFFEQLHGLNVLDLSHTDIIKLPDSVSDLVNLTTLVLIGCKMLRHVPSLEKLRELKRLDLSCTWALEKMPQGLECLRNLRYLRMNGCGEKEFPRGLLPKLSHLQVFVLEEWNRKQYAPITVQGKEVGCLRKLESLECHFEGYSDFVEYLNYRDKTRSLTKHRIVVGLPRHKYCTNDKDKVIVLGKVTINRDGDFQNISDIQLTIDECDGAKSLCDVSSLIKNAIELEVINIRNCNSMESFVSSSWYCSASPPSPSYKGIFSGLKKFHCSGCQSMKKLFPLVLLPSLLNLEVIKVSSCKKMKEITGGIRSDEEGVMGEESSTNPKLKLPKLKELELLWLPELKSINSAKLICDSIEVIKVFDCAKMKEIIGGTRSDEEGVMGEESSNNTPDLKFPKLRELKLSSLPELKRICSAKLICNSIEEIGVNYCNKIEEIIGGTRLDEEGVMVLSSWLCSATLPSPSYNSIFSGLKEFNCSSCKSIKKLFPLVSLVLLPSLLLNLEVIRVMDCEKMEEIIGGTRSDEEGVMGDESSNDTLDLKFPKLRELKLSSLPELKSICSAKLICNSLEVIWIANCKKLKRMPICLPLLENGQPSPPSSLQYIYAMPKKWWESEVEWEHPNTKDVLLPFVRG